VKSHKAPLTLCKKQQNTHTQKTKNSQHGIIFKKRYCMILCSLKQLMTKFEIAFYCNLATHTTQLSVGYY